MNAARTRILKNLNDDAKRSHINLIELPPEITTCILQWLPKDDLFNVRATCHIFKTCCDNLPESFLYDKIFASRIKSTHFVDMFRNAAVVVVQYNDTYAKLVSCIITHYANESNFDRLFGILLFAGIHNVKRSHGRDPCPLHGFYHLSRTPVYRDETGKTNVSSTAFLPLHHQNNAQIREFCHINLHVLGLTEVIELSCVKGSQCAFYNVTLSLNKLKDRACMVGAPLLQCVRCGEPLLIGTKRLSTCATCHRSFCKSCVHRCCRGGKHAHCDDCQVKNPCAGGSHENKCRRCDCSLFATVIDDFISKKLADQTQCQRQPCFKLVCHRCGWSFRCDDCHLLRRVCNECHDGIWPHTNRCWWCRKARRSPCYVEECTSQSKIKRMVDPLAK